MWCWRKMLSISWQEHRTNDSILRELGLERVNGKSGEAETTIFWPHYWGSAGQLALTVLEGIMEGSRHQGIPRRQWIVHDWRVDWLRIHSTKGDVTRSGTMEKKDIGHLLSPTLIEEGRLVSVALCHHHHHLIIIEWQDCCHNANHWHWPPALLFSALAIVVHDSVTLIAIHSFVRSFIHQHQSN